MRQKNKLLSAALGLGMAASAQADEGMWMPSQLPNIGKQLRAAGFRGNPADLADLTKAPLNAVVKVGGATGSFVSTDGLVLTNHHVAFGVIQYNSNAKRDLIQNGFVAGDRAQELPANPDFRLRVTTGFDRVTDKVLAGAGGKTGRAYFDAVDSGSKALVAECEREPGMRCSVVNMFYGRDFYLVKQLELRDVRLVYAPPRAIGNYGDEVDNFVWPRHAGDFTVLRAYVGPDGKPADYAKNDVPYHPPAHLQIAKQGVHDGDFVMLAGYPGITYRHRMAAEFADQVEWRLPATVQIMKQLQNVIEEAGRDDRQSAIRYASQLQALKNNIKRFSGELDGLTRSDAYEGYADTNTGEMPVDFLSNRDTTGGNSGSPVLNADGELVGLNFDSNWEAVSASWTFDPRYKRAIHVDMRYMRWLMDKVYPAPQLLQELGVPAHEAR